MAKYWNKIALCCLFMMIQNSISSSSEEETATTEAIESIDCSSAGLPGQSCSDLHRFDCSDIENTCGSCMQGYFGTEGSDNSMCQPNKDAIISKTGQDIKIQAAQNQESQGKIVFETSQGSFDIEDIGRGRFELENGKQVDLEDLSQGIFKMPDETKTITINELKSTQDSIHDQLKGAQASIDGLTTSQDATSSTISDMQNDITDLENRADSLDSHVTAAKNDIENLQNDLSQLETDSRDFTRQESDKVMDEVTRVETDLGNDIAKVKSDLSGAEDSLSDRIDEVKRDVSNLDCASPDEVNTKLEAGLASFLTTLSQRMTDLNKCATTGRIYDASSKSCKCENNDEVYDEVLESCVLNIGTDKFPGEECSHIHHLRPAAPSGRYVIKPGATKFLVYCDMTTDGGGWTLIESYHISLRTQYAKKSFVFDFPRNANNPPSDFNSATWRDHRLAKTHMQELLNRATQVHARCHQNFDESQNDYMFGTSEMVTKTGFNGERTMDPNYKNYRLWSTRGFLRGFDLSADGFRWYHHSTSSSPWHAGFDIGGWPNSVSSEDSFTWHDGGLQSRHKCHTDAGVIVWMLRGPGDFGRPSKPARSCLEILTKNPETRYRDGPYFIKLQSQTNPMQMFCDMSNHDGGWTLYRAIGLNAPFDAPYQIDKTKLYSTFPSRMAPQTYGLPSFFKIPDSDINAIRMSSQDFLPHRSGSESGFWTTTPRHGHGLQGAEIFHRHDCYYFTGQSTSLLKQSSTCHQSHHQYFSGNATPWKPGGHWHDNSGCYYSWAGHAAEGDHGTGGVCYNDGRGMGDHCGKWFYHRGWCSSRTWGLDFVR